MGLELQNRSLRGWRCVCHTTMEQEVTSEMIVPDACPDIWQILDGEGQVFLQRREAQDERGEFSGLMKLTILYLPDEMGHLQSMNVTLPFSASGELPTVSRQTKLFAKPEVRTVEVHVLNPRKVLLKIGILLEIEGYTPQELSWVAGVEEPVSCTLEQKTGEISAFQIEAVLEKGFTYSDALVLPGGKPDIQELLRMHALCQCHEAKVIGNKLVLKGGAQITALYWAEDNTIYQVAFSLPFSQLLEAGEELEGADCQVRAVFTAIQCEVGEDGRTLDVDLELQAQTVLRKERTLSVLKDLYSTTHTLQLERVKESIQILQGSGREAVTVRQRIEPEEVPSEILDIQIRSGRHWQSEEGGSSIFNQEVELCLLCRGETGYYALHETVPVNYRLTNGGEGVCSFQADLQKEPVATIVAAGVEVSIVLEFQWLVMQAEDFETIQTAQLGETWQEIQKDPPPSICLCPVREGETLWDISKKYHAASGRIMELNGLTSEEIYPGLMLMISKETG